MCLRRRNLWFIPVFSIDKFNAFKRQCLLLNRVVDIDSLNRVGWAQTDITPFVLEVVWRVAPWRAPLNNLDHFLRDHLGVIPLGRMPVIYFDSDW